MKRSDIRHYSEEELLLHLLGEEAPEMGASISAHMKQCAECTSVFREYQELLKRIYNWAIPEGPEEVWQAQKARIIQWFRQDQAKSRRRGFLFSLRNAFQPVWNYALDNPLPTLLYVAVAIAFASERTIAVFRLDRILPATTEVLEILKQVF